MTTLIILGTSIRPQAQPSAIAVTQVDYVYNRLTRKRQDYFTVRFLELIAARTPYPQIAYRLKQVTDNLHLQAAQHKARVILYADVTGLGQPVVDLIKAKVDPLVTCYLNASDKRTEHQDRVTIGKSWMIARLQVLFQGSRVSIPRTMATKQLVDELLAYELDPNPADNELTSSFSVGSQDQMLTALGLACQGIPEKEAGSEEFLEYMRRRLAWGGKPSGATKSWLKEWHGKNQIQPLDPLTGKPVPASVNPDPVPRPPTPSNTGQGSTKPLSSEGAG